ncbi:MAG: NfeD family protein [Acidobacteriota bacterium]
MFIAVVATIAPTAAPIRASDANQPEAPATKGTPQAPSTPLVLAATVDAVIHPVTADYMVGAIRRAEQERASVLVFTLRTPGGLVDSTREITTAMIASRTPVVVFIAPSGSRAASAGFIITMASDVAAMAPGTHIGAAHPVSGTGEKVDETMSKKMASDVAASARALASHRGRNLQLVEQAVVESRSYTEQEASQANPPLVEVIANDLADLLTKLDGREIARFDGSKTVLHTKNARIESIDMTWRQQLLSAIAHPEVAYILFTLGTLGLTIELWSPGAVLPGVAGGLCLLLAFFAFSILPINYAGLLLIVFGLMLLMLEVKFTSYGLLGVGGVVSLVLGSLMLIDASAPDLRLSLSFILPIALAASAIILFLVNLAVRAQHSRAVTGTAGMIGEPGRAVTEVSRTGGQVLAHGEIWQARSDIPIAAGSAVQVTAVHGLTLTVTSMLEESQ